MMSHHPEEKSSIGLAIGIIEVHPKFLFRFDYDDESLEEPLRIDQASWATPAWKGCPEG